MGVVWRIPVWEWDFPGVSLYMVWFLNCTHVQHIQNIQSKRMNKKQTLKLNLYEQKQVNLTICQIATTQRRGIPRLHNIVLCTPWMEYILRTKNRNLTLSSLVNSDIGITLGCVIWWHRIGELSEDIGVWEIGTLGVGGERRIWKEGNPVVLGWTGGIIRTCD